ncbi:carbohydrate-binding module family 43 protein [Aulographum hederae CBS 113979]|uniref:1,3-beta-glucanosyltransferase n=1 Tax=Aulographum hederae CBS 113979 TaxID=1176131 RepID=A0A6G1GSY6_9PEZI|nr:carbohydrate-binding module family 43 protein [Aulographum hederae CBS 113979]
MRGFGIAASAVAATAFFSSAVSAQQVDPIVIKGSKFFYKTNGTQFFMKGVAYQQEIGPGGASSADTTDGSRAPNYQDPLANEAACRRDVPILQQLQTNTIRVYAIDPTKDHDPCMSLLANAGIYVVADLSQPDESIDRNSPQWDDTLYERYTAVVDSLAKYNNVLGFFAGNEVSNQANNTDASAFVKAAVRDMKSYIKQKQYRTIGVGYATNDDKEIREQLADYFNCGDPAEAIDFWGYNIYSWCGDSSYTESGFDQRTDEFASYSVPVFFAEYGCNTVQPRKFTEVQALYGRQMTPVWSGGIVYMYFQEANDYGLVTVSGNTVSKLPDFTALSRQIASVTPSGVQMSAYNPTNTAAASCPSVNAAWGAVASPLPPSANPQLCQCMMASLTCTVASGTDTDDYEDLFQQVCGYDDGKPCAGIAHNATTGTFGAYSMCNATEQLSWAFNVYVSGQDNQNQACDFDGKAATKSAASSSSQCSGLLSEAGAEGTGDVTSAPNGGGAASTSTGAAAATTVPDFNFGLLKLGAYLITAVIGGASLILL